MQLCEIQDIAGYFVVSTLDFIAGYPATEGKLTMNPDEIVSCDGDNRRWLGRVKCFGYSIAHLVSIPVSSIVALVRVVAMPIFAILLLRNVKSSDKTLATIWLSCEWINECASIVTSPLWNAAGVVRAALGVFEPSFYLKTFYVSQLSTGQTNQAAAFMNSYCSR